MKKNFMYAIMALCMCLFAACSQEEVISDAGQGGKVVNMTVGVPGGATTRAIPSENGYKLRCIMQVVNGSNAAIAGEGMRQVKEVTTEKVTFTFTAPEGDYKCLFWADFVTDVNADYVYKTTDLASITYNKTDNALFSTAADAFCGYVANGSTTIQLKRPFAKVAVAPKNAGSFTGFNKLTVSYNAPSGFNMVTKAVSSTAQKVTYTNTSFNATSGSWFTSFIFAPSNVGKLDSDITMQLGGTESKTLTIPADKVPLTENYEINGTFDATEGNDVNVDVSFDNEFDKPEVKAPAVGDYLYADGTWGAATTGASGSAAVGVVFRIGKHTADNGEYAMNTVNGYAVALKDAAEAGVKWSEAGFANSTTIDGMAQTTDENYNGYAYSHLTSDVGGIAFNALPPVKTALDYNVTVDTDKTSGWYLPTTFQLKDIYDNLSVIAPKFEALNSAASKFQAAIYWGCIIAGSGKPYRVQFDPAAATGEPGNATKASGSNSAQRIRAVITF